MADFTYTDPPGSDNDRVRLYIGDTDIEPTTDAIFSDGEIAIFLADEGSPLSAAAAALEAIAADKARLAKKLKTLNFEEDNKGAAKELLATAQVLRDRDPAAFGSVEQSLTDAVVADIAINAALRTR